ncbi:MAG: caspase family protein [Thermoguttaceae bacterium]|nr:caspase family protein [Thermoguttaceae bacterium]
MSKTRIILTAALAFATFFGVGMRNERTCKAYIGSFDNPRAFVLAIAVDEYDELEQRCQYGVHDAHRLADILSENRGGDCRILATGATLQNQPTKENILAALEELSQNARESDLVFVAFIGLWVNFDGETYWTPQDAKVSRDDSGNVKIEKETFISEAEIKARLKDLKARRVFYLSDVAVLTGDEPLLGERPNLRDWTNADASWELQTCSPGEFAYELSEVEGSPATRAFVEALSQAPNENGDVVFRGDLDGDGVVTCLEAAIYTKRRTREIIDKCKAPNPQTPRLIGSGEDFPLVALPKKEAKDEKAENPDGVSR